METKDRPLNGIILDGKVYKEVHDSKDEGCAKCSLNGELCLRVPVSRCERNGKFYIFRFSQPLTDKINGNVRVMTREDFKDTIIKAINGDKEAIERLKNEKLPDLEGVPKGWSQALIACSMTIFPI